jgi:hypothetical protein
MARQPKILENGRYAQALHLAIGSNAPGLSLKAKAALGLFVGANSNVSKRVSDGEILLQVVRRIRRCVDIARKRWTQWSPHIPQPEFWEVMCIFLTPSRFRV